MLGGGGTSDIALALRLLRERGEGDEVDEVRDWAEVREHNLTYCFSHEWIQPQVTPHLVRQCSRQSCR